MAEPAGLGMSLDDIITKQQRDQDRGGYGKQRRGNAGGGRGGGGGRRGGGRGGGNGRYGGGGDRMEEDWHGGGGARQRHEQRRPQGRGHGLQERDPTAYRVDQRCFQDRNGGDIVFRFKRTDLVRIDASGNITLSSGGFHNALTLASLNDALNLIGIRVTCPSGDVASGEWSISDGRTLTRFADGVVLPAKGTQHAGRGRQLLQACNDPHHAQQAAAAAASNAAATMAGIMPFLGVVPPGVPATRVTIAGPMAGGPAAAAGAAQRPSVFARLGGKQQQQEQRFTPY